MITALLIVHGLAAVFLLGGITHQAVAVWWPSPRSSRSFSVAYRKVDAESYTVPMIVLYLFTMVIGAIIYPEFRVAVRAALFDASIPAATGLFEIKEHWTAIGLGLIPTYWAAWKGGHSPGQATVRKRLTAVLALVVWWNFLAGHVLNNLKGL